jgi:hypothetical protein
MYVTWLAGLLLLSSSVARADAPEFLLGDLGVRLDLPAGSWRMTRWSDWDFKAEGRDGALLLFAWATPVQTPVVEGPGAAGWNHVFEAKIEELLGIDAKITGSKVGPVAGRNVALVDAEFGIPKASGRATLRGATLEVAGKNVHIAVVAPDRLAKAAEAERRAILERLDVRAGPAEVAFGSKVTAEHVETTLPADFRPPLEAEQDAVAAVVEKLAILDLVGCFTAIRPVAGAEPDVLVTCSEQLTLGVVDSYSFEDADRAVREKTFGTKADVPPAESVALNDRMAFLYAPRDGFVVGVAPHDGGVARFWALGQPAGELPEAVRAAMRSSTFSGPHPAAFGQQVSYWVSYRPFSPAVLCPALTLLGLIGGLCFGIVTLARRPPRVRESHEPS